MPAPDGSPLLHTEVHYLDSQSVGAEYKLLIGKCGMGGTAPPVVLYLPDADLSFGGAVNILWGLQLAEYVPPMLVVGIGYRVDDQMETLTLRSRDLTPSVDEWQSKKLGWMAGGAAQFLQFFRAELKPWVAERFGVDPDDDVYAGYSLGGLFGAYVLLTEPGTFKRYALGSPSLWYDHWSTFEREAAYGESHDDLAAKVFLSAGELETPAGDLLHREWLPEDKRAAAEAEAEEEAAYGESNMVADMERFVDALRSRNYPSLVLGSAVLASEFHMTAAMPSLSRALRFLFDAP